MVNLHQDTIYLYYCGIIGFKTWCDDYGLLNYRKIIIYRQMVWRYPTRCSKTTQALVPSSSSHPSLTLQCGFCPHYWLAHNFPETTFANNVNSLLLKPRDIFQHLSYLVSSTAFDWKTILLSACSHSWLPDIIFLNCLLITLSNHPSPSVSLQMILSSWSLQCYY